MTRMLILAAVLCAACGGDKDGPAAAFRRLVQKEAGDDRGAWLSCFTKNTLEMFQQELLADWVKEQGTMERDGFDVKSMTLPALKMLTRLKRTPDNWTFAHEVGEGGEKITGDGVGWVIRKTRAGRERKYWCRLEDGTWRCDLALTLEKER